MNKLRRTEIVQAERHTHSSLNNEEREQIRTIKSEKMNNIKKNLMKYK